MTNQLKVDRQEQANVNFKAMYGGEKIQTGLTANYVPYWSVVQGLKEAMQNIAYGSIKSDKAAVLSFDETEQMWAIKDDYIGFEKRHLYIGESEQRTDEDGLGTFGEGWKIFLLVMARNNIRHKVHTVGFSFYGTLEPTPHGTEVLVINVEPNEVKQGTAVLADVEESQWKKASESFAVLQGIDTKYIQENSIIANRKNELWVQGVRIEQDDNTNPLNLYYSYNLRQRNLINRDRSHVNMDSAYFEIKKLIWRMEKQQIEEYISLALSGDQSEDVLRGPDVPASTNEHKEVWLNALATLHATIPERLVLPSYNNSINDEAKHRGLVLLDTPRRWETELWYLGIPKADDVVDDRYDIEEEIDYQMTKQDKTALSKAKTKMKNALGLQNVNELPPFQYVAIIRNPVNNELKKAHYDKQINVLYLDKLILENEQMMVEHLLPEVVAWKYGAANANDYEVAYRDVIMRLLFN